MNFPLIQQPTPHSNSPWDKVVPVVTNRHHTDVYLTDGIEEPAEYNELCYILRQAEKGDTVNMYLNTPGGIIDSAFMIIDAIKNSKAKVTACLSGTVASAGTIIALAADQLSVADHTSFMIHNYSGGMGGKGHEMKARQEFVDRSLNTAFTAFYSGFLSEKEIKDVIDGRDMWIGKEDVLKRWDDRKSYLRTAGKPTREEV